MGDSFSKKDYDMFALEYYNTALQDPCTLPDVSIDESLLKYSGIDSNTVLQTFSNLQVGMVPGFITNLGSSLASLTTVPNAVGLGALMISMIIEIIIKSVPQRDGSYDIFRRVFGEEKASSVRDTMSEYVRRHRTFLNNERRLTEELRRLETQLSNHLTILKNSLLLDEQMSTRGFKIWVNGASFHVQMLIHEARLNIQSGKHQSTYVTEITNAINLYMMDLDHLLEKYKTYMSSKTRLISDATYCGHFCGYTKCYIENSEQNCYSSHHVRSKNYPCGGSTNLKEAFMNLVFSKYEPISGLKSHFSNIKSNVMLLINQHDSFILLSTA